MATFAQIKEIRLQVSDPAGFIDFLEATTFPGSPARQTAYLIDNVYYEAENAPVDVYVSDSRISTWYDSYGTTGAVVRCLKSIISQLGSRLAIVRSDSGAESTQYTSLVDLYSYYKSLLADAIEEDEKIDDNSTGKVFESYQPEIAGGNI